MKAAATILHKCDLTRIPAGATIIKTEFRSSFHFISRIEEHQQEYVTYRTKDGHMMTCFYPMSKPAQGLVSETLPILKARALEKDSILNCDETWCRVKMQDKYKKAYICYMAHVRAKFQKSLLQGKDEQARPFMQWMGRLYDFERDYSNEHLLPDEIKKRRNGSETTEIVGSIWMELTRLLDDPLPKGDLLTKALNYLKNAWTPVMAYRHDGRYCIDNSIAERSIRTMTIECKNKLAFGSHQGAETSTVYHTFTATCRMGALSFYQFLKNYFIAFMEGRTDFENLTPAILGKIN